MFGCILMSPRGNREVEPGFRSSYPTRPSLLVSDLLCSLRECKMWLDEIGKGVARKLCSSGRIACAAMLVLHHLRCALIEMLAGLIQLSINRLKNLICPL